jgi:hypothetical protein
MPRRPRGGLVAPVPTAPFVKPTPDYSKDDPVTLGVFDTLRRILRSGTPPRPDGPVVAHLAHVVNLIQWKVRAGPRLGVSDEERAKLMRRDGWAPNIPSAIELKRGEQLALEEWIRDGIWPAKRQGYAQSSGQMRWPMLDPAEVQGDLRELERRLEELRGRHHGGSLQGFAAARQCAKDIATLEREIAQRNNDVAEYYKRANASHAARQHALMSAQPILDKREIKGWHDFAPELHTIFCAEFSGRRMKDAASRFIAAVTPAVTGEAEPTWTAVKQFLKNARAHK